MIVRNNLVPWIRLRRKPKLIICFNFNYWRRDENDVKITQSLEYFRVRYGGPSRA